jgi:hypothetical protein
LCTRYGRAWDLKLIDLDTVLGNLLALYSMRTIDGFLPGSTS